jgi:hypothetical protein
VYFVEVLDEETLKTELAGFDGLAVAACCGALQLMPANAEHADRLVALAGQALSGTGSQASVTASQLTRWLVDGPSLHTGVPWDRYEAPFCAPVSFVGGGYLVLTRGEPEPLFGLRTTLLGVVGARMPLERNDFNQAAMHLCLGALALGSHCCRIAGIDRWQEAIDTETVEVPSNAALEQLVTGVRFTAAELAHVSGVDVEALSPIVWDLDELGAPAVVAAGTQFSARPLLRRGDVYVLVEPAALGGALRHALLSLALEHGLRSDLVGWLARAAIAQATEALERMDWAVHFDIPSDEGPIVTLVARFDSDKAAAVTLVYDEFGDFDVGDPFRAWEVLRWEGQLRRQLQRVESGLMFGGPEAGDRPNELLHVIVMAGAGRPAVFAMPGPQEPLNAPVIVLSLENLDGISMAANDQLRLWKFAEASTRLRESCDVMAFSPLDEFAAWNDQQSYYFGDDGRPTMISFDPSHGRAFRDQVARDFDVHSVLSPDGGWLEAVRLTHEARIPVYANLYGLGEAPMMLVEGAPLPVWICAPGRYEQAAFRQPHAQLVDCLAYWAWQFTPALGGLVSVDASLVRIDVVVDEPQAWLAQSVPEAGGPVAIARTVEPGRIALTIRPSLIGRLMGPDNAGERELLEVLLLALDELLEPERRLGPDGVGAAIAEHAPLGPKKKINLFTADVDSALIGGDLPAYRSVQKADTDALLDEAGDHIARTFEPPVGPLEGQLRTTVLNDVVRFHYEQLEREVSVFSPAGLLESLLAQHEATVRREAVERRTLGASMAAYGETQLIERMRRSLPEATQAAVALRFLIEYVTARPPHGFRPLSRTLFDRLMAISSQIISRGMTSDIIRFAIEDTQLSFLASGRLGMADGTYQAGQQAYLRVTVPAHARAVGARYAQAWGREQAETPPEAAELDAAAVAEWGLTLMQILQFLQALSIIANRQSSAAASLPCAELEVALGEHLGWPADRVRIAVDLHVLVPRGSFLEVPPGFEKSDLWPWRYNRALSYLRRPLLRRPGRDGDEYVWGVRHPEQSGRLLFSLIESERLKARSGEMKQLMTRMRQAETQDFVAQVAEFARQRGMAVDTNVKKVAGEKIMRDSKQDLTDIDVLAADAVSRKIYLLECKDLEGARTPAELSNELASTFRGGGKKRSAAEKQVERVAWVSARISQTLQHLGVATEEPGGWSVTGAVVTDVHVLAPYVHACPLPVYAQEDLGRLFDESGAPGGTSEASLLR